MEIRQKEVIGANREFLNDEIDANRRSNWAERYDTQRMNRLDDELVIFGDSAHFVHSGPDLPVQLLDWRSRLERCVAAPNLPRHVDLEEELQRLYAEFGQRLFHRRAIMARRWNNLCDIRDYHQQPREEEKPAQSQDLLLANHSAFLNDATHFIIPNWTAYLRASFATHSVLFFFITFSMQVESEVYPRIPKLDTSMQLLFLKDPKYDEARRAIYLNPGRRSVNIQREEEKGREETLNRRRAAM